MPHKMVNEKLAEQAKQKIQEARENRKTQDGKKSVCMSLSLSVSLSFSLSLYLFFSLSLSLYFSLFLSLSLFQDVLQ